MKKVILSLCLLLFLISCKKISQDDSRLVIDTCEGLGQTGIKGQWELRYIFGDFSPGGPYFPAGNGTTVSITDSYYEHRHWGGTIYREPYTNIREYVDQFKREMNGLKLKDYTIHYEFLKDTLVLYIGYVPTDGTIEKYVRK